MSSDAKIKGDLERIAKQALRELGAGDPPMTITADGQPDRWRVSVGGSDPATLTIPSGSLARLLCPRGQVR